MLQTLKARQIEKLRNHFKKKNVLITGGSQGIGESLAVQLVSLGANVILIARDPSKLKRTAELLEPIKVDPNQEILWYSVDLSKREDIERFERDIKGSGFPIDILVHNAGLSATGFFREMTLDEIQTTTGTNVTGPKMLTKVLADEIITNNGQIAFMSSLAGLVQFVGYASYGGDKAAMIGFADGLRNELKPAGVAISLIYPPAVDTPGFREGHDKRPYVTAAIEGSIATQNAETVATKTLLGMANREFEIFPAGKYEINTMIVRWTPAWFKRWYLDRKSAKAYRQERELTPPSR